MSGTCSSRSRRLGALAATALLVCLTLVPPAAAAPSTGPSARAVRYQAVSLGTLGGESSYSTAMSGRGHVVGRAKVADGTHHGFLWRRGVMTDLGPFTPVDVNDRGEVLGTRDDAAGAWLWRSGRLSRLPGAYGRTGTPVALNNRGQVVGTADDARGRPRVVLWSRTGTRTLPLLDVSGINDRGEVSGGVLSADRTINHAALWRRGRVTDLGRSTQRDHSGTVGINDRGWVVGWVVGTDRHVDGSLWRQGRRTSLGVIEDGGFSQPLAINDRGVILVVTGADEYTVRAALWDRGVLIDLAALGTPDDAWFVGLDDRRRIAGTRTVGGNAHATLWQPR